MPVKQLAGAKQRLAQVLGTRREEFAFRLACRTMDALRDSGQFAGVIVVTPDDRVMAAARARGARVVDDGGRSLNIACSLGLAAAVDEHADLAMVVPADLARITARGLSELLRDYARMARRGSIGLVRCKEGTGTNLILLDPAQRFDPAFGPDSFSLHWARAQGRAVELYSAEASFDVDSEEDLIAYATALPESSSRDTFEGYVLGLALPAGQGVAPAPGTGRLARATAAELSRQSAALRDQGHGALQTYSRKVFLPLTQLCRDSCHYCTFAKAPRRLTNIFMTLEQVLAVAEQGAHLGCKEALFTLGDKPELRYRAARAWLNEHGHASTLHYVKEAAAAVRDRTGLLPHINAGCMTADELAMLRPACASMGLMLESAAERLCAKGGPHYGSPDKLPAVRLATIAEAGRQKIPFTTGILIGIGETRDERIESLLAIRALHERYGHIQEIIIQNFLPKHGTLMAKAPAPQAEELLWTIAAARILFGPQMSIQAPPNLSPTPLAALIEAGINDWGGVSPLTPDFVNPEAPWPQIELLRAQTAAAGKVLAERLTIYPVYAKAPAEWLDAAMRRAVLEHSDSAARGREDGWRTGRSIALPAHFLDPHPRVPQSVVARLVGEIMDYGADDLDSKTLATLFDARGGEFRHICEAADTLRAETNGDLATFVVNRNINYTDICSYRCSFCAFSKGSRKHAGDPRGYLLDVREIVDRSLEARARGATEVCLQGGIHPSFTGDTYLKILRAVKSADPSLHVHAFSPLEVWHGAATLGMNLHDYLSLLRDEGLGSLPGTAAEILVDDVRKILCPDKLTAGQWLEVIETAHGVGLSTTATIMFGHVDSYEDWAVHLIRVRDLQRRTHGFTEFVPLPFVAHEAPLYKRGQARPGPTLRESILMHAVARLVLSPHFANIQASWVKMGLAGMREALQAGANDLGGTLMNESITRAAGATHGQEVSPSNMRSLAESLGRRAVQRTTLYAQPASAWIRPPSNRTAQTVDAL
jgi:FO synthase